MKFTTFRPHLYRCLAVIALVGVTTLYLNGTRISLPESPLSSYLGNYQYRSESAWRVGIFGNRARWNSMDSFVRLSDERDYQHNYGLLDQYSEARYQHEFSKIADTALSDLISFHTGNLKDSAQNGFNRAIELQNLRLNHSTMVFAGVAAAIYTGRTLRYHLSSDLSLESQTFMRSSERRQYLGWSSAALGASGGGTYDAAAGQMNYSVHKNLISNVRMDYERTTDHSLGLSYSTGF